MACNRAHHSQFARTYPRVKLEVVVDTGIPLVESLDTGQLDLAIATRTEGKGRPGQLLFQEPLVWVASNDFRLDVCDSVPLALKPIPANFETRLWPRCKESVGLGPRVIPATVFQAFRLRS